MKNLITTASALVLAGGAFAEGEGEWTQRDEVRAIVAEMMADAETRSSLLANGGGAGWDDGFYIKSEDGNFKLKVGGWAQFRYVANFRDTALAGTSGDDTEHGFNATRTRINFKGHVIDPSLFYKLE
ncbi:MAG: hypothetical protein AAGB34_00110, partial [Planctomycetota bacterium]